jgi:F-type H+-transporting ATPase subunit b
MMAFLVHLAVMTSAFAEEHGAATHEAAHETHGVPWESIFVQTFNVVFLFALLFYLLRKTVIAHFEHRARDYKQMVERAEAARREAEKGRQTIKDRLAKLEESSSQLAVQAKTEADGLRNRMMAEAKTLSARLEQEAQRTASVELEKAKAELRREILTQAINDSRENFKKNLSSSEQQKLQREFADKIQVVGG